MDIRAEILAIAAGLHTCAAPITEDTNFYFDLGLDSLAYITLLLRLEKMYGVQFALDEMAQCIRLGRLISLIENKVKEPMYDSEPAAQA